MASSAPQIPIDLNKTAYAQSPPETQALALNAQRHIITGRTDVALECLKELLKDRRLETNPLIIDGYMMLARIAFDSGNWAEACAYLQLAADPNALAADGPHKEYLAKYSAARALTRYLQSFTKKPRMLGVSARHYEMETNFDHCHVDALRVWALGQDLAMPAETDWPGVEALRGILKQRYSTPTGNYLLIPPRGDPFLITPAAAPAFLLGRSAHMLRTQTLYNDDHFEWAMGNFHGWPEGHFFRLYEVIMYKQDEAQSASLERNSQAMDLLHNADEIYGPVLVQMCWLLKHRETRLSLIGARQPPSLGFLKRPEWKQMRMEFRAFDLTGTLDITAEQIALQGEAALFHAHLA